MEKPTVVLACGSVQHELQEKRKSLRPGQMTKTLNNNANINYLSGLSVLVLMTQITDKNYYI